jgi:AcrR family transcriptional regulator
VSLPEPAATDVGPPRADAIRQAALDLFVRKGYEAASMRDLADAVGVRPASLYHHFPSKEDILWDVIQRGFADLDGGRRAALAALPPDRRTDPVARLEAFQRSHVRFHAVHAREAEMINRQLRSLSAPRYAASVALRDGYQAQLTALVEQGVAAGAFAVPDLRVAVFALLEIGMGVSTWYRPDGPLGLDDLVETHLHLARKLLAPLGRGTV